MAVVFVSSHFSSRHLFRLILALSLRTGLALYCPQLSQRTCFVCDSTHRISRGDRSAPLLRIDFCYFFVFKRSIFFGGCANVFLSLFFWWFPKSPMNEFSFFCVTHLFFIFSRVFSVYFSRSTFCIFCSSRVSPYISLRMIFLFPSSFFSISNQSSRYFIQYHQVRKYANRHCTIVE